MPEHPEAHVEPVEHSGPPPADSGRRRRRTLLLAGGVAVAAVVAGVVLGAVLLQGRQPETGASESASAVASASATPAESTVPTEPPPTPVPTPTSTPVPTATPLPEGAAPLAWTEGTPPNGSINVLTWIDGRWLAGGASDGRASVWTSPDGLTWAATAPIGPDPIPGPEGRGYWISEIVEYHDELVAFGWNRIGCCDGGQAIAWRSADGESWQPIDTAGTAFEGYHFPQDAEIAPTGELVLLTGTGLGTGWATLRTTDLEQWTMHEASDDQAFLAGGSLATSPSDMLAVGTDHGDEEPGQLVWRSPDGASWMPVAPPSAIGTLTSVTWDEMRQRFVLGGSDANGHPSIWLTGDFVNWLVVPVGDEAGSVGAIAADNGLLVALGTFDASSGTTVWSSRDGITWQISSLDVGWILGVGGGTAVVAGNEVTGEPDYVEIPHIWAGVP